MLVAESPKQENGNFFPECVCNDFFPTYVTGSIFTGSLMIGVKRQTTT